MNIGNQTYFVITAAKGTNPKQDAVHNDELRSILEDRNEAFVETVGKYQGRTEESFLVVAPTHIRGPYISKDLTKSVLLQLAATFKQDCIAELDENNKLIYLHYTADGRQECLGKFRIVDDEPQGDYTKVGDKYVTLYDA